MRWIDLTNVPIDFRGLMNLILRELPHAFSYISEREEIKIVE